MGTDLYNLLATPDRAWWCNGVTPVETEGVPMFRVHCNTDKHTYRYELTAEMFTEMRNEMVAVIDDPGLTDNMNDADFVVEIMEAMIEHGGLVKAFLGAHEVWVNAKQINHIVIEQADDTDEGTAVRTPIELRSPAPTRAWA